MAPRTVATLLLLIASGLLAVCTYDRRGEPAGVHPEMATYIVAIKREYRDEASRDWIDTLRETPGVEVTATSGATPMTGRVTLRATADGIEAVRERVGAYCHVEPVIEHDAGE